MLAYLILKQRLFVSVPFDAAGKQGFTAYKRDDLIVGPVDNRKDSLSSPAMISTSQLCMVWFSVTWWVYIIKVVSSCHRLGLLANHALTLNS